VLFIGCAAHYPVPRDSQKLFTYDFSLPGKSKSELWKTARNFFAEKYGDSRAVFRVMDEQDGTLLGKGVVTWNIVSGSTGAPCITNYYIRFASKNDKARLQFELIEGSDGCPYYYLPPQKNYDEIVNNFSAIATELKADLSGKPAPASFKDF
jgi:hypothetical protein